MWRATVPGASTGVWRITINLSVLHTVYVIRHGESPSWNSLSLTVLFVIAKKMSTSPFWLITQRVVTIPYPRCATAVRKYHHSPNNPEECSYQYIVCTGGIHFQGLLQCACHWSWKYPASVLPFKTTINIAVAGFGAAVAAHAILVLHTLQTAIANTHFIRLSIAQKV